MSQQLSVRGDRPMWATSLALTALWGAVVTLAVVGVMLISSNGDLGGLLLLAALLLAAPAQSASRRQSDA